MNEMIRYLQTACLMALVFVQFQEHWVGHFYGYGGGIALFMCATWAWFMTKVSAADRAAA